MRGEVVPRDDRAWPRSSLVVSAILLLVAAGAGVALAIGAADRGPLTVALVTGAFVVACGFGLATSVPTMRRWIAGEAIPPGTQVLQGAVLIGAFIIMGLFDVAVGWALVAGLMTGVLVANVWAIRAARANRELVDRAEAAAAAQPAPEPDTAVAPPAEARRTAPIGPVLRDTVARERRRAGAWLVAGAIAVVVCGVLDFPGQVPAVVGVIAVLAIVWVLRRLFAAWLALRDFTKAATPPRRAFVVLLHDPAPKMLRPLLGVWSEPPAPRQGRLPRPEQVYRCDEEIDALECYQGDVVVHEAWVDTGPRRWSKPRWVAADEGMALPHRRAVLGRWYMSALIGGERPGQPQRLTLRPPQPADETPDVVAEERREHGGFVNALAGRLATLAVCGLLAYWII